MFIVGLLAGLPRKNCWTIAEHAGEATPGGMQHLLSRARWDADGVRDDLRGYVVEHLGDPGAVLVVDETGDIKKGTASAAAAPEPVSWLDAVEVDRVVPPSGNMTVGPQQFWLGTARAGQQVTLWIDATTVHLSIGGWRIKTVPSRLSEVDLARLRHCDGRPAGPPPAGPSPGALAASRCVEVDRLVNGIGGVTLLNRLILVGFPLAGQRARIRLDGQLMHVITQDGVLWRTLPCPIPPHQRHRLQGVRLAGPAPLPQPAATVQRRVSSRGGIQVARQRIQVGMTHAGKIVTVVAENNCFQLVIDGETVRVVPRTTGHQIDRYKAYATHPRKR
jgi:hypothetical protein